MRAWQALEWCEPEAMQFNRVPVPMPGPSQVLIRNHAAALNFFDLLQIQGKYQAKLPLPFTPGAEVAGIVEAVGSGVTNVEEGDRVLALTNGGGYAEASIADSFRTFPIPAGMDFARAAATPIVYHTSCFALKQRANLRDGEWLLVHAAGSGVGMSAIQIGKALGARVIATAGEQRKLDFALQQGAEHAINYSTPDWVDHVKEITERRGADVIYDPVGGDVFDLSTRCTAPEGRILVIGFAGGRIPTIQTNRLLLKNISVVGVFWGDYAKSRPWYVAETQTALEALYASGQILPVVGKRYPLEQAPAALRDLAERRVIGKAILEIQK
jgi:NADPH:quinone reductase